MFKLTKSNFAENKFSLICNGFEYKDCWESIDIRMSMDNICNEIRLSTLNFFEDKLKLFKSSSDLKIKKGSSYIAKVNDEIIGVGYIDDIGISYDGNGSSIEFYMRDKTSDLVDCCWVSEAISEFKNETIENIVKTLCQPFKISVTIDPLVQNLVKTKLENFTIDTGRSIAEIIVEECAKLGVLVNTDGKGNLYLTQPTLNNISSDILTDTNIIGCEMKSSLKDRFSNYIVKAEMKLDKKYDTEQEYIIREKNGNISNRQKIEDAELRGRFRPLVLMSDTAQTIEDCTKRALYEANIRRAKSLMISYTLEGWTEVNSGKVWKPNLLVNVKDKNLDVDELMLVNSVNLNYSNGFTTNLELVRKECYSTSEQAIQLIKKGF